MYNETKLKILEIKRAMLINNLKEIVSTVNCDTQEYSVPIRTTKSFLVRVRVEIRPSETRALIEELNEDLVNLDYGIKTMLEGKSNAQEKALKEAIESDKPQTATMDTVTDSSPKVNYETPESYS